MKKSLLLQFSFILCSVGWGQSPTETRYAGTVSQLRLQQSVHDLVGFSPRMGGTARGDECAKYLLKTFQSYGIPAEIVADPELLAFTNEHWSISVEEPASLRTSIKNEWLAGFSPSVKLQKARVVQASVETKPQEKDYTGLVVLTERAVNSTFYEEIVRAGAVCILSYAPGIKGRYDDCALITNLRSSSENPIPLFNLSYNSGSRLKAALQQGSEVVISFSTKTVIAKGRPKTVVATLKGASDDYYIVCAHGDSDSGGPGADDNASGVAGVLELARTLNGLVLSHAIPPPKRSIKFIAWGSEYFSTQDYVIQHGRELGKILGVMNFDEIGTGAERNCLYIEPNDVPHNQSFIKTLTDVAEQYVGKEGFWEEATTNPSQGGTDSYVFLPDYLKRLKLADVKIPSVTIYTAAWDSKNTIAQTAGWHSSAWKGDRDSVTIDYSRYYHSSLDIPGLTTDKEPFNMVWAVKEVGIVLLRMAW